VAPNTLLERLGELKPEGLSFRPITITGDNPTSDGIALSIVEDGVAYPVHFSFVLREAAAPELEGYEPDPGPNLYARDDIFEGFRQNVSPLMISRSWLGLEPWRDFTEERQAVLLYEP
jgi:hypothetical protein